MAYSKEDYKSAIAAYEAAFLRANGRSCKVFRGGQFLHICSGDVEYRPQRMKKLREMTEQLNARPAYADLREVE